MRAPAQGDEMVEVTPESIRIAKNPKMDPKRNKVRLSALRITHDAVERWKAVRLTTGFSRVRAQW